MYTIVEYETEEPGRPSTWIVMADNGHHMTRPCSWRFALACILRWTAE